MIENVVTGKALDDQMMRKELRVSGGLTVGPLLGCLPFIPRFISRL